MLVFLAGETTAIGEPRPGPEGRIVEHQQNLPLGRAGGSTSILGMAGWGFGIALGFALIGRMF